MFGQLEQFWYFVQSARPYTILPLVISRSNIPQKRSGKKFVFSLLEMSLASCTLRISESKYPLFYFPKCPFICKIHENIIPRIKEWVC